MRQSRHDHQQTMSHCTDGYDTLDVLVQDTEYNPEKLIGQPVSLALLCDDGSQAPRHGLVESVRYLGSDGGLHDWQLVFAPWFSLLEYRSDCRIW